VSSVNLYENRKFEDLTVIVNFVETGIISVELRRGFGICFFKNETDYSKKSCIHHINNDD